MAAKSKTTQPIPTGYHTVTPWIISRKTAELLDFVKAAFGAEEIGRVYNSDGTIGHAETRIGDSAVMMFDARENWLPTPCFLRLYVADAEATFQQALRAGATVVTEITELGFGDQVGRIRDPFGNLWWIQEHLEDLSPEEMGKRAQDSNYTNAMQQVEQSLDREMSSRSE